MSKSSIAIVTLGITWWITAWLYPSTFNGDPELVIKILAVMGLIFIVCGIYALHRSSTASTFAFFIYCVLASIHWAGPIGFTDVTANYFLLAIYIIIAATAFNCAFLAFALQFIDSKTGPVVGKVIWSPVVAAVVFAAVIALTPVEFDILLLLYPVSNLIGLAAGLVLVVRTLKIPEATLHNVDKALILSALILSWAPNQLAQVIPILTPDLTGLTNLSAFFLPLALVRYLVRESKNSLTLQD